MDAMLEHFHKVTAINAWDLADDGMRSNPVIVTYCPADIESYKPKLALVTSDSIEQSKYIDEAVKFIREQIQELGDFVEVSAEKAVEMAVDSILAGWDSIMNKGHTVGIMLEATVSVGLGLVGGVFVAFDKTGRSVIGFAGIAAGATAGVAGIFGGFYYEGSREGLEGFGGQFNATIAVLAGVEWEAMFTGANTGNTGAITVGGMIALSVEFQYAWLIAEQLR